MSLCQQYNSCSFEDRGRSLTWRCWKSWTLAGHWHYNQKLKIYLPTFSFTRLPASSSILTLASSCWLFIHAVLPLMCSTMLIDSSYFFNHTSTWTMHQVQMSAWSTCPHGPGFIWMVLQSLASPFLHEDSWNSDMVWCFALVYLLSCVQRYSEIFCSVWCLVK